MSGRWRPTGITSSAASRTSGASAGVPNGLSGCAGRATLGAQHMLREGNSYANLNVYLNLSLRKWKTAQ
jgi:nitrogenase subunit NifH